jgi:uncharacterized repeat protein (TIGR02543 family)
MRVTGQKTAYLAAVLCAGLLLFGSCKDLFHSEDPAQPKEFTITFDAAGGSPGTQTKTVRDGGTPGSGNMPAEPARDGYTFDGWYTEANGGGNPFTATSAVTGDITVYAKWTVNTPGQYTVTYHANGASGTPPAAQPVSAGSSVTIAGQEGLSYTDYVFSGWNTSADGTGTMYNEGDSFTPAANLTLFARWMVDGLMVIFDADGGTPAKQTRIVAEGGIVGTLNMPSEPTRSNYTFGGWYTVRNGGGDRFYVDTVITGYITVYARWTVIPCTVTFDADGGSPTGEQRTVNSGAWVGTPNKPPDPVKSGYIFGGWYTGKDGGASQFYVDTVFTGNITVYA